MRKFVHIIRIFFLVLYAVYALTPIHMYAMAGTCGGLDCRPHPGRYNATDIVWVNVLFTSLFDDGDDEESSPVVRIAATQSDGDVILVKKRRTLVREQFDCKPLCDTKSLPPCGLKRPSTLSPEYDIAKDQLVREIDGSLTLNSGLSPPSLLS